MTQVREVTNDDWEIMRDVRLAALREAPYAFSSTYAREVAFTEAQWRARISARSVTFFGYASPAAEPAGLAGVLVTDGEADLVSMWVRPPARGSGIGEALIATAAGWTAARGHAALSLWVTETNGPARRLYERCGFTPTGDRQPLPSDRSLMEIRMLRPLPAPDPPGR